MYLIELIPAKDIHSILPMLKILDPNLADETLRARLDEMVTQGYKCVGIFDQGRLIGISGLWIMTKYYVGKHIEPDNVVIDPAYRNKGIGELLLQWIYEYGKSQGCIASELNCYISNDKGQRFWMNEGYKIVGFHFQKQF
jgi:GNAT superfamily N-acetyltransferase